MQHNNHKTLEEKIKNVLLAPPEEPEALTYINILQAIGWYRTMFGYCRFIPESKAVMIIADYMASRKDWHYGVDDGTRRFDRR